ncbi:hypothetical protein [Ornithinimicrobium cerasi]|uniref:Uncharacterized protein n=1 Tax=Ornithinimicrobium cerasi TaxID=2248773 RepID=A0A285VRL4_9MICO|nr:hypothetical protein [Ornithinimicrobium cerasi]SOC56689.1 hypothetical protein SAMN05421879_10897 [Ornithinimicrobium cerasi]
MSVRVLVTGMSGVGTSRLPERLTVRTTNDVGRDPSGRERARLDVRATRAGEAR